MYRVALEYVAPIVFWQTYFWVIPLQVQDMLIKYMHRQMTQTNWLCPTIFPIFFSHYQGFSVILPLLEHFCYIFNQTWLFVPIVPYGTICTTRPISYNWWYTGLACKTQTWVKQNKSMWGAWSSMHHTPAFFVSFSTVTLQWRTFTGILKFSYMYV